MSLRMMEWSTHLCCRGRLSPFDRVYITDIDSRGKVFVYTGILPICQDEDGLAAVLGHEIAHVVAHHPAERMSNSFLTIGAVFLVSFLFDVSGQLPSMMLNLMYSLPNSRTQEAEADNIGLSMPLE
jgi:Zn-dependent protease with chaperone function